MQQFMNTTNLANDGCDNVLVFIHEKLLCMCLFNKLVFPGYINSLKVLYSQSATKSSVNKSATQRQIPQQPERIMDAPELIDDYCKSASKHLSFHSERSSFAVKVLLPTDPFCISCLILKW